MSRWFRHYTGLVRDEKLVSVAVKSKQPVERVVWLFGAILESACEIDDDGKYELDPGEAAYFLRCDESDICSILDELQAIGRLSDGVVTKWGDRQFISDTSRDRQKRYRERRSDAEIRQGNGDNRQSDVTKPSRDAEVTLQDTDTDTDTEEEKEIDKSISKKNAAKAASHTQFDIWYSNYPHKVGKAAAVKAFAKAESIATLEELQSGLQRYIDTKPPDRSWCNPATWLNENRWLDQPSEIKESENGRQRTIANWERRENSDRNKLAHAKREILRATGLGGDTPETSGPVPVLYLDKQDHD